MDRPLEDAYSSASDELAAAEAQSLVRHQLRAPLAVIQPVIGMLLDGTAGPVNEKQLNYLTMLERNVSRLAGGIASVVESGWLEVAAVPMRPGRVDVADLVRGVADDVRASVESAPRLEVRVADSLPCVRGDAFRLGRALRNVVLNACSYTPRNGLVGVRAETSPGGERVIVVVEDSGCGVAPDDLAHVFELGYRGEAAKSCSAEGLGLGLAVARAIVREHGGAIVLERAADQGARVSIELPAAAS